MNTSARLTLIATFLVHAVSALAHEVPAHPGTPIKDLSERSVIRISDKFPLWLGAGSRKTLFKHHKETDWKIDRSSTVHVYECAIETRKKTGKALHISGDLRVVLSTYDAKFHRSIVIAAQGKSLLAIVCNDVFHYVDRGIDLSGPDFPLTPITVAELVDTFRAHHVALQISTQASDTY